MPKADAAIAAPQSVKRDTTAGSRIACGFVNSGMAAEPPCKRPRALPVAYLSRIEVRQALDKHLTRTLLNPHVLNPSSSARAHTHNRFRFRNNRTPSS